MGKLNADLLDQQLEAEAPVAEADIPVNCDVDLTLFLHRNVQYRGMYLVMQLVPSGIDRILQRSALSSYRLLVHISI